LQNCARLHDSDWPPVDGALQQRHPALTRMARPRSPWYALRRGKRRNSAGDDARLMHRAIAIPTPHVRSPTRAIDGRRPILWTSRKAWEKGGAGSPKDLDLDREANEALLPPKLARRQTTEMGWGIGNRNVNAAQSQSAIGVPQHTLRDQESPQPINITILENSIVGGVALVTEQPRNWRAPFQRTEDRRILPSPQTYAATTSSRPPFSDGNCIKPTRLSMRAPKARIAQVERIGPVEVIGGKRGYHPDAPSQTKRRQNNGTR